MRFWETTQILPKREADVNSPFSHKPYVHTTVFDFSWDDCPGEIGNSGFAKLWRCIMGYMKIVNVGLGEGWLAVCQNYILIDFVFLYPPTRPPTQHFAQSES